MTSTAGRRRILVDLTPLRTSPDFRRLWWSFAVSSIGTQIAVVAVGLQVYALTGSTLAVGLLGLCALVPLVSIGLYGGALVDAHDRRTVTVVSSVGVFVPAVGLAVQAWLDLGSVGVLYGLVALQSAAAAVNNPARSAVIPRLVDPADLPAANALRSIVMSLAMGVGPLVGAVLVVAVGYPVTYTLEAVALATAVYAALRLPSLEPLPGEGGGGRAGLRSVLEGLRYLAGQRVVRMTFLIDLACNVLANPRVVFPAAGVLYLGGGPVTAGVLASAIAVGSLATGVFSGRITANPNQGRAVVGAGIGWAVAVAGFGTVLLVVGPQEPGRMLAGALVVACVLLALAGAADTVGMVHRGTILQQVSPDGLRGRLQGVFVVVVTGGPRAGESVTGVGAEWWGEAVAVTAGGLACVAVVLLLVRGQPDLWTYRRPEPGETR
ncbi:MFS transporter [Pseudonocardia sp. NPDC046786]|uniref:MFS transporter n=1 Tax=Pseudonocardia sp. NPDC046786 TaxID=3155471 RepID=UPI0033F25806